MFLNNLPPVVAIAIVKRLSSMFIIVVPVVLDELLNLKTVTYD
jgi:phage-related holin